MLTDAQAHYVRSFLRHRDALRARRESGITPAETRDPIINLAIEEAERRMNERYAATIETVTAELAKIAFFNIGKLLVEGANGEVYPDFSHIDAGDAAAISEMTVDTYMDGPADTPREVKRVKVKLHPKTPALQLLGNALQMWQERHSITLGEEIEEKMRAARNAVYQK